MQVAASYGPHPVLCPVLLLLSEWFCSLLRAVAVCQGYSIASCLFPQYRIRQVMAPPILVVELLLTLQGFFLKLCKSHCYQ